MNPTEELRKALNTASGTGDVLIPEVVTAGVREYVEKSSPLYAIVPKLNWPTNLYIDRSRTALNGSAGFLADGASLMSASQSTFAKPTWEMKYAYVRGEVTGPMIAATGNVADAKEIEIMGAADALVRAIELNMIDGDSGTTATQFDGYFTQITNTVAASSAALSLDLMDQLLDKPEGGQPTHLVMKKAYGRKLWALLQAHQTYITSETIEVQGGFRVPSYGGVPIIRVDQGAISGGLATGILGIDMRNTVFPINKNVFYKDLAVTKDSEDFFLGIYCTLAVQGPSRFGAKLTGLAA